MSRHRNVRSMNYTDEYDGYDDVYGHSVEDDYSISPSDAAFMYDRNRQPQMSAFLTQEEDIAEEDETEFGEERRDSKARPVLSDTDEARLRSCLEEIRNVIGDTVSESVVIDTILAHDFDLGKALDAVLTAASQTRPAGDEKQHREKSVDSSNHADDNSKTVNSPSIPKCHSDCKMESLRQDVAKLDVGSSANSKTRLKSSQTSFPAIQFPISQKDGNRLGSERNQPRYKTRIDCHLNSSDDDEEDSFTTLSSLAALHKSITPKESTEFSSLADLAKHHLHSKPDLASSAREKTIFVAESSRFGATAGSHVEATLVQSLDELVIQHLSKTAERLSQKFVIPPLKPGNKNISKANLDSSDSESEKSEVDLACALKRKNDDRDATSETTNGSGDEQMIDLSVALKPASSRRQRLDTDTDKDSNICVMDLDACPIERPPAIANKTLIEFYKETDACRLMTGVNAVPPSKPPSHTGKTICHKWPVQHRKSFVLPVRELGQIVPFKFDTPSPDDLVLSALQKRWTGSIP